MPIEGLAEIKSDPAIRYGMTAQAIYRSNNL
jgi:hypothetical protein